MFVHQGELAACMISMLRQMKESHYKAVFDVSKETKPLRVSSK